MSATIAPPRGRLDWRLLLHAWLTTRTGELVDSVEMASVKFLNSLKLDPAAA